MKYSANRSRVLARKKYQEHHDIILKSNQMVHHVDGNPFNNDINNLNCLNIKEHNKLHLTNKIRKKKKSSIPLKKSMKLRKKFYDQGYDDLEIAKKLELKQSSIQGWRKRHNLPPNRSIGKKGEFYTDKYRDEILQLCEQGLSDYQIALKIGKTSYASIRRWRERNNIPSCRIYRTSNT